MVYAGGMKVHATRHVLAVRQLERSVRYYREVLGFTLEHSADGWAFLSLDAFRVMLGECPGEVPASRTNNHSWFAHVLLDDVDEFHAGLKARGAAILNGPADRPWGMRDFQVETIDGHRIVFSQELARPTP